MVRRVRLCGAALEARGLRSGGGANGEAEEREGDAGRVARDVHRRVSLLLKLTGRWYTLAPWFGNYFPIDTRRLGYVEFARR